MLDSHSDLLSYIIKEKMWQKIKLNYVQNNKRIYKYIHDTQQQTKPIEVQVPPDLGLAHTECGSVQTMFVGT